MGQITRIGKSFSWSDFKFAGLGIFVITKWGVSVGILFGFVQFSDP